MSQSITNRILSFSDSYLEKDKEGDRGFYQERLSSLSIKDREKFKTYGLGKQVSLPYKYIHHAFEDFVLSTPHAIAVECAGQSITYQELNSRANQIASVLLERGVCPGDNVGLFLSRSIDLVAGILGVLKVGAAYVPQDARIVPKSQLSYIVKKAHIKVILSNRVYEFNLPKEPDNIFLEELLKKEKASKEKTSFVMPSSFSKKDSAPCFILFTSGTTGRPNGVRVTHKNVINILLTQPGNLGIASGTKVAQILNISFDMSAWEILGTLANGGTLLVRGPSIQETVEKANVIISTPSILSKLDSSRCKEVKTIAVAGEPCPKSIADEWSQRATFYNCCGPTETTIVNTVHKYEGSDHPVSIGAPTPNNTVYILDEHLKPLPIGEVGEMYAGGECVTEGYLGNPDLNAERYKEDPFVGGKMFKTRDLGRWNHQGELEHYGRTDDQVKIRGFRIELDSISSVLEEIPKVKMATTIKLNDRDLAAFVVSDSFDEEAAQQILKNQLQYYCIPAVIVVLSEFPVTDRGKVDKTKLTQLAVDKYDQSKSK